MASCIHHNFSTVGQIQLRDDYVEDESRCMKYVVESRLSTLASVQIQLDNISRGVV